MAQPIPQAATGTMDLPGLVAGRPQGPVGLGLPPPLDDCERRVRTEVARELHERVARPLTALLTGLEDLKRDPGDRRRLVRRLDLVQDQVRAALLGLREVLCELREQEWLDGDLVGRLRGDLERTVIDHPHVDVRLRVSPRWPAAVRGRADHVRVELEEAGVGEVQALGHGPAI